MTDYTLLVTQCQLRTEYAGLQVYVFFVLLVSSLKLIIMYKDVQKANTSNDTHLLSTVSL